jgi:hypothetical protein
MPSFKIGWNFGPDSVHWFVVVEPATTWAETKSVLAAELSEPASEEKYGLSPAAASLFEWVRRLDEKSLEHGLTPVVEKAIRDEALLLKSPWSSENLMTLVTLLCEEITDLTPYDLRPMPWHESYSSSGTRIRVRKHQRRTFK